MNQSELLGLTADERLLGEDVEKLPATVGRPEPLPEPSAARGRVVAVGATLTGLSLLLGVALIAAGIVEAIANAVALAIVAIVFGLLLVGTHWGWVHVAEWSGQRGERRRERDVLERRRQWLRSIQPYTRHEVVTSVDDDGSIRIVRLRKTPVPSGERTFTFRPEIESEEVHSADAPGAAVAERAELARRLAAADTKAERELFEMAEFVYETALLRSDDEEQQRLARLVASRALSEQINTNLRDPPLTE